ncbi:MAG: RNA polymerase sigma factor [Bacillota bacterium]|nr:RNA polymerase sigma factor [Bacillota bacterium]
MPPDNNALDRLLADVATGDRGALREVYEETRTAVYGYALSIVKNREDAEDILQDTYVTIYRSAKDYRTQGKPMAWIFTIVRNLGLMRFRQSSKATDLTDEEWDTLSVPSHEAQTDNRLVLEAAIHTLAAEEREIVMLHAVSGVKHKDIAEHLQIPLSTVLSKYRRALQKLRTVLEEKSDDRI